jgi:hypothetical protein
MQPYGLNNKMVDNVEDVHPKKGYVMWWEVERKSIIKKRERFQAKLFIEKEDGQDNQEV